MSVIGKLRGFLRRNDIRYDNPEDWKVTQFGSIVLPEKLTESNAYTLASKVSEINYPVDFHADRISKLRFFIADKDGKEVANTELNRFISNINPLYSFSDLIYQYVFCLLSDGNAISYLTTPNIYKKASVNSISRWDVLQPDMVDLEEYYQINTLTTNSIQELIKRVRYTESSRIVDLDKDKIRIDNYSIAKRNESHLFSKSPFESCSKSIDTLLAVYAARYNVYANNGAAGYLCRKTTSSNNNLEAVLNDSTSRDAILKDINDRNGLTGRKNIWGISSVPLEMVNTLVSIGDLMPLEETLENSIKIASILQIPAQLVPRKDQSTFNNQDTAEKSVWENATLSILNTVCENLTKIFTFDKIGYKLKADISTVSALISNKSLNEDFVKKQLDNLKLIQEITPTNKAKIDTIINEILKQYGNE